MHAPNAIVPEWKKKAAFHGVLSALGNAAYLAKLRNYATKKHEDEHDSIANIIAES
jgi:hypothetical protein